MVNPFDRSFFKFLFGFLLFLGVSFTILYLTGRYESLSPIGLEASQK